jgi:hypothetical protein
MAKDDTGKTQGATASFQGVELPAVHHHEVCTRPLSEPIAALNAVEGVDVEKIDVYCSDNSVFLQPWATGPLQISGFGDGGKRNVISWQRVAFRSVVPRGSKEARLWMYTFMSLR